MEQNNIYKTVFKVTHSGGSGSCFYLKAYDLFVTNYHVTEGFRTVAIHDNERNPYLAKVVLANPAMDIALLAAEGDFSSLPDISLAEDDTLTIGRKVYVAGYPYGMPFTITEGSVSSPKQLMDGKYYIQTDAAVNPGNSGGALVNTKGELVGINTLIQSRSGTYIGYAFAVPTSIVKKVVVDLKEHGVVQRAMLGIQYIPLTEEFLETEEGKKTGIQEPGGIYVAEVDPEGAAHAAGIRSGDVIVEINGIKIDGSAQLSEEIAKHRPNDKVTVGVKKGSDVKQIEVVLRNKAGNTEVITKDIVSAYDALGGLFAEVSERTKKALKIGGGVQVVGIEPGGILESARIRKGYIITNINDRPVRSIGDLNRITSKIEYIEGVYPDGRVVAYSPTVK